MRIAGKFGVIAQRIHKGRKGSFSATSRPEEINSVEQRAQTVDSANCSEGLSGLRKAFSDFADAHFIFDVSYEEKHGECSLLFNIWAGSHQFSDAAWDALEMAREHVDGASGLELKEVNSDGWYRLVVNAKQPE